MSQPDVGISIPAMGFMVVSSSLLEPGTALVATVTQTKIPNSNRNTEPFLFTIEQVHGRVIGPFADTDS